MAKRTLEVVLELQRVDEQLLKRTLQDRVALLVEHAHVAHRAAHEDGANADLPTFLATHLVPFLKGARQLLGNVYTRTVDLVHEMDQRRAAAAAGPPPEAGPATGA